MDVQLDKIYDDFKNSHISEQQALDELKIVWSNRTRQQDSQTCSQWGMFDFFWQKPRKTDFLVTESNDFSSQIFILCNPTHVGLTDFTDWCAGQAPVEVNCIVLKSSYANTGQRYTDYANQVLTIVKDWFTLKNNQKTQINLCVFNQHTKSAKQKWDCIKPEFSQGLFGIVKSAAQENQKIIPRLIQFNYGESSSELIAKIQQLKTIPSPDSGVFRYRGTELFELVWKEIEKSQSEPLPVWRDHGVYLITGGLGGLGLIFAQEIASKTNNATVILVGRSLLPESSQSTAQHAIAEIKEAGAECVYYQADITKEKSVTELFKIIHKNHTKLNGIIHSAGVNIDNFIINKTAHELEQVCAPKVSGLLQLDLASQAYELDLFVLFSSMSAVCGNLGQADYAAANAYMDAYSEHRNHLAQMGLRQGQTLSINWPLWRDGGMQVDAASKTALKTHYGIVPMSSQSGFAAFYQAISENRSQVMVVAGDIKKISTTLIHPSISRSEPLQQELTQFITQQLANILALSVQDIDEQCAFRELGCDAINLVSLSAAIEESYDDKSLSLNLTLDTSINKLSKTIAHHYQHMNSIPEKKESHISKSVSGLKKANTGQGVSNFMAAGKNYSDALSSRVLKEKSIKYFVNKFSSSLKVSSELISTSEPLETYGVDSLMIMELTRQLESVFGSLPKTLFFEYQTIEELSEYFIDSYRLEMEDILQVNAADRSDNSAIHKTQSVSASQVNSETLNERSGNGKISGRQKKRIGQMSTQRPQPKQENDIAIIGVAGRYPQAPSVNQFWENLKAGKDCITEIPNDRWNHNQYFDENKNSPGKSYSKWGGFIDDVDKFDSLFFNITPNDARLMDPQERLFLECVYATMEDAGYTREELASLSSPDIESNVGVFVGAMYQQYQLYGSQHNDQGVSPAVSSNIANIANRISYFCNFNGPSIALDTMCSSSLTTLHLACQSIRQGEIELALAGGVNVSIHPNKYIMLSQGHFVSSKGRCESFGLGGEGYVPCEGVGAVLLKPLRKAIADGDHIYGVIKGTSVNHGGRANGYTVPNPNAQAKVIRNAFKRAGVDPRTVSYMEAHGTGTTLGDPIEILGLNKVFMEQSDKTKYCAIGSVKSNIGHAESAAGIAGITKILLQLKHRQIAPSLHSGKLNPNIDFENSAFVVQQELADWQRPLVNIDGVSREFPRIAGISSFGAGGSNAHVVIEEYTPTASVDEHVSSSPQCLVVLSAKSQPVLERKVHQLLFALSDNLQETPLKDIAYTSQLGREAMDCRLALIVTSKESLATKLSAYINNEKYIEDLFEGHIKPHKETFSVLADEDVALTTSAWIAKCKYDKLLSMWVKGLYINWSQLHVGNDYKRVSLPGYPFDRTRYWVDNADIQQLQPNGHFPVLAQNSETKDDFFYKPAWQESTLLHNSSATTEGGGNVLFVYGHASTELVSALESLHSQDNITKIELANTRNQLSGNTWQIRSDKIKDHLMTELSNTHFDLVYFISSTHSVTVDPDLELMSRDESERSFAFFRLIKGLNSRSITQGKLNLKVVTQNVHQLASDSTAAAPVGGSLSGITKTLCNEYAKVSACCIDIDTPALGIHTGGYWDKVAHGIFQEAATLECSEVVLRGNHRYQRQFEAAMLPPLNGQDSPLVYRKHGIYAIWGGASGIGLALAKYLATYYQARVAIIGRSKEDDAKKAIVAEIVKLGGEAIYISADIGAINSTQNAFEIIKRQFGGIHGVVHSAVVLNDIMLSSMTEDMFGSVMAPKLQGSCNLAKATCNDELDFMLVFSSVAGFAGMPGQANYAAAATFQDSFACYLNRNRKYNVKVIDWGFWGSIGVAANERQHAKFLAQGILPIETQEGIEGIERILGQPEPQIVVFKAKESVLQQFGIDKTTPKQSQIELVSNQVNAASTPDIAQILLEEFSTLTGYPINDIDQNSEWTDMGVDSIKMMAMLGSIESRWGIRIYPNELEIYTTLSTFSDYLAQEIADDQSQNAAHTAPLPLPSLKVGTLVEVMPGQEDVASVMLNEFSSLTGIPVNAIDVDADWADMGVDSIKLMAMLGSIESRWGIRIYPNELEQYATLKSFSKYLGSELELARPVKIVAEEAMPSDNPSHINATPVQPLKKLEQNFYSNNVSPLFPGAKPLLYVLSTPRAGSTLLRVMLMGNPEIFSPPELHLLPFDSSKQRAKYFADNNRQFLGEGFIETIAELENLSVEQALERVGSLQEQDVSVAEIYAMLQDLAGDRFVVDKSPSYASDMAILKKAETTSKEPLYIFLVRHPIAVMESFVRNRFDKLLGITEDPWEYAQELWLSYNNNLRNFLATIPAERQCMIRYEELVKNPEIVIGSLCQKWGITYNEKMLKPYEGDKMTKGLRGHSMTIGDPNFAKHNKIEPSLAGHDQHNKEKLASLRPETLILAEQLGYDVGILSRYPLLPSQQNFMRQFSSDPVWHIVQHTRVREQFDVDLYTRSLQQLINRHMQLQMSFTKKDGNWEQQLNHNVTVTVDFEDLSKLDGKKLDRKIAEIESRLNRRLDLNCAPLMTSAVVKLGEADFRLILVVHHLVSDGITLHLIEREWLQIADAERIGTNINQHNNEKQKVEYLKYLEDIQQQSVLADTPEIVSYWKNQFSENTLTPSDYPLDKSTAKDHIASEKSVQRILTFADFGIMDLKTKGQAFEYLSVGLYKSIAQWTGQSHVVLAHRLHRRDLKDKNRHFLLMGWLAGDVVLGFDTARENETLCADFRDQYRAIPAGGLNYELLHNQGKLAATHDVAAVRLNFQPENPAKKNTDSDIYLYESPNHERQYLLDVIVRIHQDQIKLIIRYSENRHNKSTIQNIINHWVEATSELTPVSNDSVVKMEDKRLRFAPKGPFHTIRNFYKRRANQAQVKKVGK
ncbi:MAG: acyl transferase domain-containing protein/acyl carrier protein [Lentisphaeria bacterium]